MNELLDIQKTLDDYLGDLTDRQQQAAARIGARNHGIDERRLGLPEFPKFQSVPHCLYFFYVRINSNGRLFITHHFYPGGDPNDRTNPADPSSWPEIPRTPEALTPILQKLALDARPKRAKKYPKIGDSFDKIRWCRKSYIAFFIDEANWTLHVKAGEPAVVFITDMKDGVAGAPNLSFFDALNLPITMPIRHPRAGGPTTDQRSAVVFVNHMKADEEGNDLGAENPPRYQFKMIFNVAFENKKKAMTVIFDPDGDNLGPPVPPP